MDNNTRLNANNKLNQLKDKLQILETSPINGDLKQIKKHTQNINYCRKEIANLESFLSFAVGQKVTNGEKVGEISTLALSPGGMPEVWVSWTPGSAPTPEQPARLQIVDASTESLLSSDSKDNQMDLLSSTSPNDDNIISDKIPTPNAESSPEQLELKKLYNNEGKDDNSLVIDEEAEALKEKPSTNQLEPEHSLTIDEELKALIPALSQDEKEQLEVNLLTEGIREPLVVWKHYHILLDGHNRYEIAFKHNLPFTTVEVELPDKNAARLWLINNQLGRRNLSPETISYLRGQRYNLEKATGHNVRLSMTTQDCIGSESQNNLQMRVEISGDQNDHLPEIDSGDQNDHLPEFDSGDQSLQKLKTAERLADIYNVSSGTIRRDAQFATALSQIASVLGEQIKQDILARQLRLTKKAVFELAQAASENPDSAKELLESFKRGQKPEIAKHLTLTPGCLVQVNAPDQPDLHERVVRVAKVTNNKVDIWHRQIETMQLQRHSFSMSEVDFVPFADKPHVEELNQRLEKLKQFNLDPFERDFLALFDRCVALTPAEEKYLSFIERHYLS